MKRKFLRKSLAFFMVVCALVQTVGAVDSKKSQQSTEIVFFGDIDKEKAELITAALNGEEIATTRSILCTFGHSLIEDRCFAITHYHYSTSPKCKQDYYKVLLCSRSSCNYINFTLINTSRISCCP